MIAEKKAKKSHVSWMGHFEVFLRVYPWNTDAEDGSADTDYWIDVHESKRPLTCQTRALPHTGEEAQRAGWRLSRRQAGWVLCCVWLLPAPPPWINHPTTSVLGVGKI